MHAWRSVLARMSSRRNIQGKHWDPWGGLHGSRLEIWVNPQGSRSFVRQHLLRGQALHRKTMIAKINEADLSPFLFGLAGVREFNPWGENVQEFGAASFVYFDICLDKEMCRGTQPVPSPTSIWTTHIFTVHDQWTTEKRWICCTFSSHAPGYLVHMCQVAAFAAEHSTLK